MQKNEGLKFERRAVSLVEDDLGQVTLLRQVASGQCFRNQENCQIDLRPYEIEWQSVKRLCRHVIRSADFKTVITRTAMTATVAPSAMHFGKLLELVRAEAHTYDKVRH